MILEVRDVSKQYRQSSRLVKALDSVSVTADAGEFVVVRGPSGCGKTTLLLTAGGLLAPDSGRILINGQDPYALSSDRRANLRADNLGFVFQQFHLIPYLTVLENVMIAGLAGSSSKSRADRTDGTNHSKCTDDTHDRAEQLLEQFQLSERATHTPGELSTGERQRVALARAMLNRPRLILADEPTGNLDPDNAAIVLNHLTDHSAHGGAVLMVTHETALADNTVSRTIHLPADC